MKPLRLTAPRVPEQAILKQCMAWTKTPAVRAVSLWYRVRNDAPYDARRGIYLSPSRLLHRAGVSDMAGIWRGLPAFVELKADGGRLRPDQEEFLEEAKGNGAITIVAYSLAEMVAALRGRDKAADITWRSEWGP